MMRYLILSTQDGIMKYEFNWIRDSDRVEVVCPNRTELMSLFDAMKLCALLIKNGQTVYVDGKQV